MIHFVKLYTRRFHVTSKIFLRKIAPKTSSNDQTHVFTKSKYDSSSNCPDYLGIESEENVITVKSQNHRFQQSQKDSNREKFYRTSFGIVRFDADNKLAHHGQYKRKINFSFPYNSNKAEVVRPISETYSYKNQNHQDRSLKDCQKGSETDILDIKNNESTSCEKNSLDANYIDNFYFGTSDTQNTSQQQSSEELNYLEKDYFETLVDSRNLSEGHTTSNYIGSKEKVDSISCHKNQQEESNYLEKDYFRTLTNLENLHLEQNSAGYSNSERVDISLSDKNQFEKNNYLKKDYFEPLNNSESCSVKQNISSNIDNEEKINSACDNINDQENFSKNNSLTSAVDELSFLDKKIYENNSSPGVQNTSCNDNMLKSSSHLVENNNIISKTMHNRSIEKNKDDKIKIRNEASSSVFSDNSDNESIGRQAYENLSSSKVPRKDTMSQKNIKTLTKNLYTNKKLDNEPVKSFSVKNSFQFSKLVSEEPDPNNNEMSTAHDFVKKLREEQKIPSQIIVSKEKAFKEEKVDSKGFRVLKNQVPPLTHFTHDEILNILKQNIVYSDDDLLILNKPYNLVIHESKTTKEPCLSTFIDDLAKDMDKRSKNPQLFTVHRLDKETTGCLLLARNETMAMKLKALFAQRKIVKKYWIITAGVPDPLEGVIDIPISEGSVNSRMRMVLHPKLESDIPYKNHSKHGRPAVTTYKVISESGNAALVEVFPKTGIKHQIRVHFGFGLGCPVLGDHKYSHLDKLVPQKLPSDMLQRLHVRQSKVRHIPMHIHAKSIGIPEYFDKRDLFVNIPIPDHFKINLKRLKFSKKNMVY